MDRYWSGSKESEGKSVLGMKRALCMATSLALSACCWTEAFMDVPNMNGTVVDASTKARIAGAKITLWTPRGTEVHAIADANGDFSISKITFEGKNCFVPLVPLAHPNRAWVTVRVDAPGHVTYQAQAPYFDNVHGEIPLEPCPPGAEACYNSN